MTAVPFPMLDSTDPDAIEMMFVAEGYDTTNMHLFVNRCTGLQGEITGAPWYIKGKIKLWRLEHDSSTSVTPLKFLNSCKPSPNVPNVSFDTNFGLFGACNFLTGSSAAVEALDFGTSSDTVVQKYLVIVNSLKWGGSGLGKVAWVSGPPSYVRDMGIHELGHTFGLEDEYENKCGTLSSALGDDVEKNNISTDYVSPPWLPMLPGGTPLAAVTMGKADNTTCVNSGVNPGTVGAYEGAYRQHRDVYRPFHDCRMRTKGVPFCPVCCQILRFEQDWRGETDPIDN